MCCLEKDVGCIVLCLVAVFSRANILVRLRFS